MKGKLTKITNIYTLLDKNDRMIASDDLDMQKDYQIGKLSKQNCDEIFGVVDVEKLAEEEVFQEYYDWGGEVFSEDYLTSKRLHFTEGFNKAMELNKDKVFTLEDMRYFAGFAIGYTKHGIEKDTEQVLEDKLKSLQQPTEIEVTFNPEEKDSEGCLILKKI